MNTPTKVDVEHSARLPRRWSLSTAQLCALLAGAALVSAGCATMAQHGPALSFQPRVLADLFKVGGAFQCTGLTGPVSACTIRVGINSMPAQISGDLKKNALYYLCRPNEWVFNQQTQKMECVPVLAQEAM
jgi:hypothetical protein